MLLNIIESTITTKHGHEIRIERVEDAEGDENRGWQVDEINAFVGDMKVGYLKMSYIPAERFKRKYPSIINYLTQIGGWTGLLQDNETAHWQTLDDEGLRYLVQRLEFRMHRNDMSVNTTPLQVDRKSLLTWVARLEKELLDGRAGEQFISFKKHHVNKPLVDYIRVAKGTAADQHTRSDNDALGSKHNTTNFRQKGIGRAMYMAGAQWLKEKGMVLRASSLQQPEAMAAWTAFKREGLTRKDKDGRTYLSV